MIIQFNTKLTSASNSQNRGGSCSNLYPEVITAKPHGRQKFSYPVFSDLLNYTLNLKFVNIAFSLGDAFLNLRVNPEFIHEFSRIGANANILCENLWAEAHTYPPVPRYFGMLDGGVRVSVPIGQVMA